MVNIVPSALLGYARVRSAAGLELGADIVTPLPEACFSLIDPDIFNYMVTLRE